MARSLIHKSGTDKRLSFITEAETAVIASARGQPSEVVGPQGPQGDPGPIGVKGINGNPGAEGLRGLTGDKGPAGIQGVVGNPGLIGLKGTTGGKGTVGLQGPIGDKGIVGLQGATGDKGIIGLQGLDGDKGIVGLQGATGDKGIVGLQGLTGDKGIAGLQGATGDKGIVGLQGPTGDKGATGPAGTSSGAVLAPIRSAAISLTAAFSGSSTKVTYSNLLHDEGNFFNPANPGVLKIPADYGSQAWVQPSYYFESGSSTGQRTASLVQVVSGVEIVLTGYRNLLVANGLKGTSFRGAWLLVSPGTEFYVAYSNGTAALAMGIGAWFQIEVRKAV